MSKCSYCGKLYDIPHGLTLVMKDGVIKYLCSSKCRKVRWVLKSKKSSEKVVENK